MAFSITLQEFEHVAPNLHHIVFDDVILKLINCQVI